MAESVNDDDTALRDGDVETTVVPDLAPTQATELAWSEERADEGSPSWQSWRAALAAAAAIIALSAGGVLLISLWPPTGVALRPQRFQPLPRRASR